jgi:hypothetical protein
MNSIDKKQPDIRIWIRLKKSNITDQMTLEMADFKTQSDYFLYILKKHFKNKRKK